MATDIAVAKMQRSPGVARGFRATFLGVEMGYHSVDERTFCVEELGSGV